MDIPLASRLVLQLFWEYSHGESLVLTTMSQKHDLHACIVGHSFVRRLQDAVGGAPRILSHRDAAALNAPDWFRIQDHYHRVDFFGQSGYTVSMLQRDITSAGLLYPDVVIIESGSNDLCYRECDIDALVTGLFSYTSMLREVHGVRLVIMASVLNRDQVSSESELWAIQISFSQYKHSGGDIPILELTRQTDDRYCPVKLLQKYLALRPSGPGPVFVSTLGKPISRQQFLGSLHSSVRCRSLDPSLYYTHSFRIGRSTDMMFQGYSDAQIRAVGRWKSDAYKRYIRPDIISA